MLTNIALKAEKGRKGGRKGVRKNFPVCSRESACAQGPMTDGSRADSKRDRQGADYGPRSWHPMRGSYRRP